MQEQKNIGRTIGILLVCMIVCLVATTLVTPSFIDWYASPIAPQGVSCAPSIHWALNKMLAFQLISVIFGAILGSVLAFKLRKKK